MFAWTLACALTSASQDAARAAPDAYQIGAQDKLRITVSDWPPGAQEFRTRLDGVFTVGPAGNLSLPLVGDVPASGLSTREIGKVVSESFRLKLGAVLNPTSSVEVVEFRPIYTVGIVDRPGSYPYRPGMTVLHAVSLSGGFFRRRETDFGRLQREIVSAVGDISLHKASRDPLVARKARLLAEMEAKDTIAFPGELTERRNDEKVARLMGEEQKLLTHRLATLEAGLNEQAQIKATAQKQALALEAQEAAQERQLNVAKRELAEQSDIVAKGLARRPVLFTIEQRVGEAEARKRQLQSDLLKNAQDILKAEQTAREQRTNRHTEVMNLLSETDTALAQLDQRIATASGLAQTGQLEITRSDGEVQPVYSIVRQEGEALRERPVHELAEVLPGDIVRVTIQTQPRGVASGAERLAGSGTAEPASNGQSAAMAGPGLVR